MSQTLMLGLDLAQTQSLIKKVMSEKIKAEVVDIYEINSDTNPIIVMVYEKYFTRVVNEASLTITIDKSDKFTRVHITAAAGGSWLGKQDFAAEDDFESYILKVLETYKIKEDE